jgi:hypothetical protein
MDKQQIYLYVQIGAVVAGVITALVVVTTHPIPVILLGVEAGVYFVAEYLRKH